MNNVEDFYPLSALQQGMLYHSLYAPETRVYVEQLCCRLRGPLDAGIFRQAWQRALAHYPVLRTAFLWEGLKDPVQVVFRQVELPWEEHDWRDLPPEQQQSELARYLDDQQRAGFVLSEAPLLRLALLWVGDSDAYFVWTHHHLLLDGWSLPLIVNSVLTLYTSLRAGVPARLPTPRPFRDYIAWLWQQNSAQAETFWRSELAGLSAPTPLWTNQASSPPLIATHEIRLAASTSEQLRTLARQAQVTLNTMVQGAWALLLGCYSGERDVLFGITVAGRPADLPGVEQMVGLFINTLPLRVGLPPQATLGDWLSQLHHRQSAMRAYEYCSLIDIQGWSAIPRTLPLFESLFVFENYPLGEALSGEAPAATDTIEVGDVEVVERTNYPLTLVAAPGEQVPIKLLYDSNRFDQSRAETMLEHLGGVLEQFAAGLDQRLGSIVVTREQEYARLAAWGRGLRSAPAPTCVYQRFEAHAARAAQAPAISDGMRYWSYGELNRTANQLARHLYTLGVGPERCVGVYLDRQIELVASILAVHKAGAAYLPIDARYPRERVAYLLRDSAAPVLITTSSLAATLGELPAQLVCLDQERALLEQQDDRNLALAVQPAQLAYVVYTSGSTGLPKGVLVSHANLHNLVDWHLRAFDISAADRATQIASPAFDAMGWEVWPYLAAGACLVIPDHDTLALPESLRDWLIAQRISVSFVPTPLAEQLLACELPMTMPLRLLLTGGDRLRRAPERPLPFRLINNYGPTEATVVVTSGAVEPCASQAPAIGRPIDNTELYVLDELLRPVPMGVTGQLYIGGPSLARGYRNRPDLTAERFVPNPFVTPTRTPAVQHEAHEAHEDTAASTSQYPTALDHQPASARPAASSTSLKPQAPSLRLYATGDLVRWQPDGSLAFLSRADQQVKIRGVRIEPGEIEATLSRHPAVQAAAVVARDDQALPYLAAYAVATPGTTSYDLLAWLRQQLPEALVPATLLLLPELPTDQHGKLDRRALPAPAQARSEMMLPFLQPRDYLEYTLAQAWEEVLGVHPIGVRDNFFELGGHSMLAIRLVSEIGQRLDQPVSLPSLVRATTIEEMAQLLRNADAERLWSPILPLKPAGTKTPFFCVHPLTGIGWAFANIARHFDPDRPFFALQARGIEAGQEPYTTVEEMATCYVEAIRAMQPEGPYYIGGFSFGGYVAFEMALQLREAGEEVAMLVILDTARFTDMTGADQDDADALIEMATNLGQMTGRTFDIPHEQLRELSTEQQLQLVKDWLIDIDVVLGDVAQVMLRGFQQVANGGRAALRAYQQRTYSGPVTVIRSEFIDRPELEEDIADFEAINADPTLGWQEYVTEPITVCRAHCSHSRMIVDPEAREVAALLQGCLG